MYTLKHKRAALHMLSSYTIRGLCHVCHSPCNTVYHLRQLHFHNRETQQQQQKQQLVSELALIQPETSAIRKEHTCLRELQSMGGKEVAGWVKICAKKKKKAGSCVAERQTGHLTGQLQLGVGVCVSAGLVACCDQITCSLSHSGSGSEMGRTEW